LSNIFKSLIHYPKNKWLQFGFAVANLSNILGIRLLHYARQLITHRFYAFEHEKYTSELVELNQKIQIELKLQKKEYPNLRYSFGYPYQGLNTLGVFGARSTEDRWHLYGLSEYLNASDKILDIGCNCGFMSIYSSYRTGCKAECIDINNHMLNIGRYCAEMMRIDDKILFINSDFTNFKNEKQYQVVFSFAAHHTEDKQHQPDLRVYFEKIYRLLSDSGLLVFESHGYDLNDPNFQENIENMRDLFDVVSHKYIFEGQRELFYFRKNNDGL